MSDSGLEDEQLVPVQFTQGELDMIWFTCLHDLGHPMAAEFTLNEQGVETLVSALDKIQEWMDSLYTNGEPDVVSPE